MKADTYFEHYRPVKDYDGAPVRIGKVGAAMLYKASDTRSGAPVVLTLLPQDQIAEEARPDFEEQAKATLLLDHLNIVRTVEFAREGDNYAFISEYPQSETLAAWVAENGPMSPDAVLRVALQVVSALGAASFHRIVHRGISPANIAIVSGQTAEGGWPAVKLLNFPIAGQTRGNETPETSVFASPEQLDAGVVDFRSEVYSLGGTMCFLLTGSFYTAEPRSLQTKRFAKPLRRLITPMLRQNPAARPQDPVVVAHEMRKCLQRIERRQTMARRFGIPFQPVATRRMPMPRPRRPQSILAAAIERPVPGQSLDVSEERTPRLWPRRALAIAGILLAAATVAAMFLPAPVSMILHRNRDVETMGVPVGVAQAPSPALAVQGKIATVQTGATAAHASPTSAPNEHSSVVSNSPPPSAGELNSTMASPSATPMQVVSAEASRSSPAVASLKESVPREVAATNESGPAPARNSPSDNSVQSPPSPPAEGPTTESERAAVPKTDSRVAKKSDHASADESNGDNSSENAGQSGDAGDEQTPAATSKGKSKIVTKNNSAGTLSRHQPGLQIRRAISAEPFAPNEESQSGHHGSVRAQFVGRTPEGGIVLRFPNGQTAVIPPPPGHYEPQSHPRRTRRVFIERGVMVAPPPYAPYSPDE